VLNYGYGLLTKINLHLAIDRLAARADEKIGVRGGEALLGLSERRPVRSPGERGNQAIRRSLRLAARLTSRSF
jgi:hypothetical protein